MARNQGKANALWSIFGYFISGLLFWGAVGWAIEHFLGRNHFTLFGLIFGMAGALYLAWLRFRRE